MINQMKKFLKIKIKLILKKIILSLIKFLFKVNYLDKFEKLLAYTSHSISNFKKAKFEHDRGFNLNKKKEIIDERLMNLFNLQLNKKKYKEAAKTISWLYYKNLKHIELHKYKGSNYLIRQILEIYDDPNLFRKFTGMEFDIFKPLSCSEASHLKSVNYIETSAAESVPGTPIMSGFPDEITSSKEIQKKASTYPGGGLIVKDCYVFPRSTSIFTSEGEIINDKASHKDSQKNILIVEKPIVAHFSAGLAIYKNHFLPDIYLDKAIHLLLNNSRGWGHWHYFNLPRIEFIMKLKISKKIPILIDSDLPIQAKQSLNLYLPGYKILEVNINQVIKVKELYFPRESVYTPAILKINSDRKKMNSVITTSPNSIKFLRSIARQKAKKSKMISKYLYLSRKYTNRRLLINRQYLDDLMSENNFTETFFEKLDFETQISSTVFAEKILGQLGSATDYIINQDEKSKSIIIAGKDIKTWGRTDAIIKSFGIDCRYLLAENNYERFDHKSINVEKDAVSDLKINEENTLNALKWLIK